MSPRRYDRTLRLAAAEEARRRIVEATVALHARHGALGTGHAMIAREAGVSVPTVYKYFPTRNDLIPACTGYVAGRAPVALDEGVFADLHRIPDRVHALVRAVFALHEYFAPWLRWSDADARALPALRSFLDTIRHGRLELLKAALTPSGAPTPKQPVLLLAHSLLEFGSWRILTESGMTSERAAHVVAAAIIDLQGSQRKKKERS